ncbi:GPI ethanolamine phosphate transferas-like protein 2 [Amylocarpus encephaloides]|uniref:GPI ethanolamine phosphate transferase 2 n=1 Tax=Amylocarpus encephaloides TaxID=45428 RepID=A0A9P7YKX8_9HELO|nr:GPI ethanolamine phosphate transferas-like protein 2 [Amylocarpus encephaloides]
MTSRYSAFCLVAANILIPIAILTFASGFFPYKPFLSGLAQYETLEYGPPSAAPFDKLIFMVVDALRSDFVYTSPSGFNYTQSLISSGAAIPFTAHATSPTITMPRIKAITTGSIPSFLDVILNFAESDTSSTLAAQDTWLAQMKAKEDGKMVMYGDDTWLKLFPGFFDRADGTSSFFVADFTEVDNNVTRHVPGELANDDWNTMVLHYLGLDHIGHKAGPRSPNMIPKQHEMDDIVSQIYSAIESREHLESTLLVLCGDHGMNDAGNHGGSSPGETSPALVFISPKLKTINSGSKAPASHDEDFRYYSFVEQSDIAPTFGALLGFPIPRNNLGAFIPAFLPFWPNKNDKIQILWRNARQIVNVIKATFPIFESQGLATSCHDLDSSVDELACEWRIISQSLPSADSENQEVDEWASLTTKWLKHAQDLMSGTASNYNVKKLVGGQSISALALGFAALAAGKTIADSLVSSLPLLAMALAYGAMMTASSFVEEEHHFWYWATTAWLALISVKCQRKGQVRTGLLGLSSVGLLLVTRIVRRWNQTGQKWTGEPDIAKTFFFEHRIFLWILVSITYLWNIQVFATTGFRRFPKVVAGAIATSLATAAVTFKLAFTHEDSPELLAGFTKTMAENMEGISLVTRARIVFAAIGLALSYTLVTSFSHKKPNPTMRTIHNFLALFLITQSRATNIPLLLLFEIQFYLLNDMDLSLIEITTTSLLLQHTSFFASGGSNAISSIDLSSAYNGVSGYKVVAVGMLTFASNWTGPIFWTSATMLMLLRLKSKGKQGLLYEHLSLLTLFVTSSLLFVMAACTILRSHLFIWTVFSPKYLYSMAWSLGQHLSINVVFGSVLYWLGTKYL